eukprot:7236506-Pyramimonas_sp.AAC.1
MCDSCFSRPSGRGLGRPAMRLPLATAQGRRATKAAQAYCSGPVPEAARALSLLADVASEILAAFRGRRWPTCGG